MMRPNRLVLAVSLALAIGAPAQPLTAQSSDETAIRQLRPESAAYTDDAFFFSGAYARPIIGSQARKTAPPPRHGEHKNFKATDTIQKLQIAKSGDLAYAYGSSLVSFEGSAPFEAAFLRVYRKEGGKWKIAAMFARPLDEE